MSGRRLEFRESEGRLTVVQRLRPVGVGRAFIGLWLAVWFAGLGGLIRQIVRAEERGEAVTGKQWLFLGMMVAVAAFVTVHTIGLWRGWREVEFSRDGIVVREKRWRLRERRYPAGRVARVRGTFPGWTETLLFDFDGQPVGLELPFAEGERERVLAHPAVRAFAR